MTLDEAKLCQLMANLESDWIERTRSTRDTDKLSQAICAFANDFPNHGHPGYLLIGVDDTTGAACGLQIGDDVLQRLGGLRSDGNIQPLPAITVTRISLSDGSGDVAVPNDGFLRHVPSTCAHAGKRRSTTWFPSSSLPIGGAR